MTSPSKVSDLVKPNDKIEIVTNKEIIIYKNDELFKHFNLSKSKILKSDELYILDYLQKKYKVYEL